MFNIQDTQTTSKKITYVDFPVGSPSQFSVRKTAMYGMIALLSIFMISIPTILENTSAYATDLDTTLETGESSLMRIHFDTGSPVHPSLVLVHDQEGFIPLEERTNMKKHFSYEPFESNSSEELTNTVLNHGRS